MMSVALKMCRGTAEIEVTSEICGVAGTDALDACCGAIRRTGGWNIGYTGDEQIGLTGGGCSIEVKIPDSQYGQLKASLCRLFLHPSVLKPYLMTSIASRMNNDQTEQKNNSHFFLI